ncbi:hypothetical protein [Zophobihabitans entericus]|uniref:Uncharacterized protein n=1 Tax=Zophobihabitans entericus TaxID=1635327 RepID=A0A6G9ICP7_9GAMM|nr:hypothetical protein [Zophobihabitans entericus]QIQ22005.1 hypothetical protein IPMB12_10105 [Zophobihabitans entericus]
MNEFRLLNKSRIAFAFLLVLPFSSTQAAYTATTIGQINGTPPYLNDPLGNKVEDYTELLKIRVNNPAGGFDEYKTTGVITVPRYTNMSDIEAALPFDASSIYLLDNSYSLNDDDGDTPATFNGSVNITFTKNNLTVAKANVPNEVLTNCNTYQLRVAVADINVKTTAGLPTSDPAQTPLYSRINTYTFQTDRPALCYIKTVDLDVSTTASYCRNNATNCTYSVGYNPDIYNTTNGFLVEAVRKNNLKFPVTAFRGAQFTLVGSGSESEWSCSSTNNTNISLSGCTVKFNSKMAAPATITMTHTSGVVDTYVIPATETWLDPSPTTLAYSASATSYPAASYCRDGTATSVTSLAAAHSYFVPVNKITNAPVELTGYVQNLNKRFARDLDGTVLGEWGKLTAYTDSGFNVLNSTISSYKDVWTSQNWSATQQFSVDVSNGVVRASPMSQSAYPIAACSR